MKVKYFLIFSILFAFSPVFAEDDNSDIYEDGMAETKSSYQENMKAVSKMRTKQEYPNIEGHLLAEYYVDVLNNSEDKIKSDDSVTNSYLYAESEFKLNLHKNFFLETKWYLKPVNSRLYTGDNYAENPNYVVGNSSQSDFYGKNDYVERGFQFSSYGLGIETLNMNFQNSNLAFGLGKINPTFGSAFDKSRFSGIFGISLPEEYELTEKIGGYVSAIFPFGTLRFNAFFDDTTGLSDTIFNSRGKYKSEGGAGNTEKLNNFSLTFNAKFDDLSFNLGYRELKSDLETEKTERGFVVGAEYLIDLGYDVSFLPFTELSYINNFDGIDGRNVTYFTVFLPIIYQNWHFIASNTSKFDYESGYNNYTSYVSQLSFGYKFDFGLMVDVARVWERDVKKADGFTTVDSNAGKKWVNHADSWAFMLSYMFKF